jgi:hypothetical protein
MVRLPRFDRLAARVPSFVAPALMGLAFVALLVAANGCQDRGIGRQCCTSGPGKGSDCVSSFTPDSMEGTGISDNDLKCITRICAYVQPDECAGGDTADCQAKLNSGGPDGGVRRAECTDSCTADGDCPEGFLCARPVRIGRACCRPFCIRREFVPINPATGKPDTTPANCTPSEQNNMSCPNVPVTAPK